MQIPFETTIDVKIAPCLHGFHCRDRTSSIELIKFGTSIAGHVVPTLASFKVVELADSVKQSVELVTFIINYSLECIDNQLAKIQASSPGDFIDTEPRAAITQQDLASYLSDVEGLEGVELRQLGSFLKSWPIALVNK